jgi:putative MFS transporter
MSLYNWVEKLNLTCRPEWQIGFIGSSLFIGTVVTTIFLPALSDRLGRKFFFMAGTTSNFIVYTFLMINTNYWIQCALLFVAGLNSPNTYVIGFGFLQEFVGNKSKNIYAMVWSVSEGLIFVYTTIYYWKIDRHWFYILSVGYLLSILSMIGSFLLPESPSFLINAGELDKAKKSLEVIAKVNGR